MFKGLYEGFPEKINKIEKKIEVLNERLDLLELLIEKKFEELKGIISKQFEELKNKD
jgi:hypothetical protein